MKLDFSKVSSDQGSFEPLPEGQYLATVFEVKLATSKNSGNEYYSWTLQVQNPPKYKNRRLFHITSLAPNSLWNLKATIEAVIGEPINGEYDPSEHIREFLGKPVLVQVTQEMYQDVMRNRVKRVSPAPAMVDDTAEGSEDDVF